MGCCLSKDKKLALSPLSSPVVALDEQQTQQLSSFDNYKNESNDNKQEMTEMATNLESTNKLINPSDVVLDLTNEENGEELVTSKASDETISDFTISGSQEMVEPNLIDEELTSIQTITSAKDRSQSNKGLTSDSISSLSSLSTLSDPLTEDPFESTNSFFSDALPSHLEMKAFKDKPKSSQTTTVSSFLSKTESQRSNASDNICGDSQRDTTSSDPALCLCSDHLTFPSDSCGDSAALSKPKSSSPSMSSNTNSYQLSIGWHRSKDTESSITSFPSS